MGSHTALTAKEKQVLKLLARGMGNREIANEQGVSINTIKTQLKAVYRKLGVHSRYAAMNYILKQPKSTDL